MVDSNFVDTYENKYTCCGVFTPGQNSYNGPDKSPECFGWDNNIPIGCQCDPHSDDHRGTGGDTWPLLVQKKSKIFFRVFCREN